MSMSRISQVLEDIAGRADAPDSNSIDRLIVLLQKFLDGEFGDGPDLDTELGLAALRMLREANLTPSQREVLYLRGRLLNSLTFDRPQISLPESSPLLTLDFKGEFAVDAVFDLPAPWALLKALSLLATFPVLTEAGAERRELLLGAAPRLANLDLPLTWPSIVLLARAWMFCSYASRADRHTIKAALNRIACRALDRLGVRVRTTPRRLVERPRLLVIAEAIRSSHVQYRYFARYLHQMRRRFHVILAAPSSHLDAAARALAHEVVELDVQGVEDFAPAAAKLELTQADLVFWPSVGMSPWGPFLANLRFAPLQLAGLGHSASTLIPAMDYYLTEQGYVANSELFSERLLLVPDESLTFEDSPAQVRPSRPSPRDPERLTIAVPGNALKLNPIFINTLREIDRLSARPIRFIFFPNLRDQQMGGIRKVVRSKLRDAVLMSRQHPNDYLCTLSGCDLALSPFPFGGLHSDIDALCIGIPVVALQGVEPHARTDALVLQRLGLGGRLLAQDADTYVAIATDLIRDDDARVQLSQDILARRPYDAFFAPPPRSLENCVGEAVWAAYRQHDKIGSSNEKVWLLNPYSALKPGPVPGRSRRRTAFKPSE